VTACTKKDRGRRRRSGKRGTFSALPAEQNIVGGLALNPDRG
jgi:hypothetical protein